MTPHRLALLYLVVTLLPLALAAASLRPPRPLMDELAAGAGMLAFSIILVEFVLSGRFRRVSGRIGMDVTMRLHQLFARSALVLAAVHPFLYQSPDNPALPWDPTRQLTIDPDFAHLWSGIGAWLLLIPLVLLAIQRDRIGFSYEFWRLTHGVGAALIAGLTLHHALEAGRYSADPALAWLWIGLVAVAGLTLAHIYVLVPILQRRRPWRVTAVRPAALKTWELTVAPDGHAGLDYRAGQFAWLNVGRSPFLLAENPFSICSAPGEGRELSFLIKELGDFTGRIGTTRPGTRAYLDAPHGTLVTAGHAAPGIGLIAGGIGIAPMFGILRQMRIDGDCRPSALVYGNRLATQIAWPDELEALSRTLGTELVHVLSEPPEGWTGPVGMVDADLIRDVFGRPGRRDWLYVLCGPPAMMETAEETLLAMGVPARNILSERFVYD